MLIRTPADLGAVIRDRRKEPQCAWPRSIPLPPEADDGETVTQQPRVSWIAGKILIPAVDQRKKARIPPVWDLQEQGAITLVSILGTDGNEVRRKLNLAVFQVHRVAKIDDAQVVRIGHRK